MSGGRYTGRKDSNQEVRVADMLVPRVKG